VGRVDRGDASQWLAPASGRGRSERKYLSRAFDQATRIEWTAEERVRTERVGKLFVGFVE
jgi:hypothetical protein